MGKYAFNVPFVSLNLLCALMCVWKDRNLEISLVTTCTELASKLWDYQDHHLHLVNNSVEKKKKKKSVLEIFSFLFRVDYNIDNKN